MPDQIPNTTFLHASKGTQLQFQRIAIMQMQQTDAQSHKTLVWLLYDTTHSSLTHLSNTARVMNLRTDLLWYGLLES